VAASPTLEAFHAYIAGEIDGLDGRPERAIEHYDHAIALARSVGSTFVDGIASVGRLSQMVRSGDTSQALDGYRDLIAYWERTGSWAQMWTTLRNLADLLELEGEPDAAAYIRAAAADAPDAPPVGLVEARPSLTAGPVRREGRSHVLEAARQAIGRRLRPRPDGGRGAAL
jgi:tetratricopeptide (TPR) repeat protein